MKPQAIIDIECFSDYFLVGFTRLSDGGHLDVEKIDDRPLDGALIKQVAKKYELINFNGDKYDIPLLKYALTGATLAEIKAASDEIISNATPWNFAKRHPQDPVAIDSVDLIEVAPGQASLKKYAGRLHAKRMQDLPFDPRLPIGEARRPMVREYCANDRANTLALYEWLRPQIELRRAMSLQYHMDLRSKSDAQIAEAVLRKECRRRLGFNPVPAPAEEGAFSYRPPAFIERTRALDAPLRTLASRMFTTSRTGAIAMPDELAKTQIRIGRSVYQMGMGGLHSQESRVAHVTDDEFLTVDWDVASYYPSIILQCGLYPETIGEAFLEVYRGIVSERLAAKAAGDKAKDQALKITLNGSFGKLGSPYSALYSPSLMVQVTVTGQLALLMLIEALEAAGCPVVSANTDGVVVRCPRRREDVMRSVVASWEGKTGFAMERTDYRGLWARDVNSYVAITEDGKVKTKGAFSTPGHRKPHEELTKNPQNEVCNLAVVAYLRDDTPVEDYVRECDDVRRFVTVREVKGGAVKGGEKIGKVVRWYYARDERGTINYHGSGNQVPRSFGARPLMELPDSLPPDVDHDWYVKEAYALLSDLGARPNGQLKLF